MTKSETQFLSFNLTFGILSPWFYLNRDWGLIASLPPSCSPPPKSRLSLGKVCPKPRNWEKACFQEEVLVSQSPPVVFRKLVVYQLAG